MRAVTTLHDGDTAFVALAFSEHPGPKTYEDAYDRLVKTADYWHQWLAHGDVPGPPVAPVPAAQRADAQGPELLARPAR